MNLLVFLESIHGHLGVLAAAALLHPAILLRKGKPLSFGKRLSVILSTSFTAAAFALGIAIYEDYRAHVKRDLFRASTEAGFLFETKEHLAYAVLAVAAGACACALLAPRDASALRKLAALLYAVATVLCAIVAGLGTYVASIRSF